MGTTLASRFKNRRLALKLSQADLAEGICKQARISRIEKGNYSPGAELLYKLAKKMNVSVEYFFDDNVEEKSGTLDNFKDMSRKLLDQRDYETLKYIYDLEISKNNKLSLADQLYLSFIESVILFFREDNKDKGIELLQLLLKQVNEKDSLYLTFSNALLAFLFENEDFESYRENYIRISKVFDKLKINTLDEVKTLIRFRYNYCRYLWLNKDKKAVEEILSTIEMCRSNKTLYLLADLYCLLGNISESFKKREEVKKYYENALVFYREENNEKLALSLEQYIGENF